MRFVSYTSSYNYLRENNDFPCFLRKRHRPTDGRTDRRTDRSTNGRPDMPGYRGARAHLKRKEKDENKKRKRKVLHGRGFPNPYVSRVSLISGIYHSLEYRLQFPFTRFLGFLRWGRWMDACVYHDEKKKLLGGFRPAGKCRHDEGIQDESGIPITLSRLDDLSNDKQQPSICRAMVLRVMTSKCFLSSYILPFFSKNCTALPFINHVFPLNYETKWKE